LFHFFRFYFAANQASEDSFRDSETSSVTSPLSPRIPPPNGHQFPPNFNGAPAPPPNMPANMMNMGVASGNPAMQMQAGMYPPFRMNGQAANNSGLFTFIPFSTRVIYL